MIAKKEITNFLIIGLLTVTIDYTIYWLSRKFLINMSVAKAIGFISGTIFSFLANRKITFKSHRSIRSQLFKFIFLYISTLLINVMINNYLLEYQTAFKNIILFAFIIATSTSAIINYIGMKYFVFYFKNQNN